MKSTRYKNLVSKWLFTAFLILSFFTFSGLISQIQTNPGKPQTTLITVSNPQLTRSLSYKRALKPAQPKFLSLFSFVNADHLYTQQVKVRIKQLGAAVLLPQTALFYKVKTIPQNTVEEPASLIG
jgi:hypothetical protein